MPDFDTSVIHLINQLEEIGEKQLSDFGYQGGQISHLMHILLKLFILTCGVTKSIANKLEFMLLLQIGKKIDRELHSLCAKRVMPLGQGDEDVVDSRHGGIQLLLRGQKFHPFTHNLRVKSRKDE